MTRQEYNESNGIRMMIDAGDLTLEVDDQWKEFIDDVLDSVKKIGEK